MQLSKRELRCCRQQQHRWRSKKGRVNEHKRMKDHEANCQGELKLPLS